MSAPAQTPTHDRSQLDLVRRSCPICEASCGLRVYLDRESQSIERIEGDPDDFRSRGYLCPKAYAVKGVYEDPDRLHRPIRKRDDGSWEELGWDEALDLAAERIRAIQQAHGNHAVGLFVGEPTGHDVGALLYTTHFMMSFQSPRLFSSATNDQVEARFLLTPDLMQRLINLEKVFHGSKLRCAFQDGELLIALEGGDLFEPGSLFTPLDNPERVRELLDDFAAIFNLIDSFADPEQLQRERRDGGDG